MLKNIAKKEVKNLNGIHILGVHKGGTTRIYEILNQHPDIIGSRPKQHLYFKNTNNPNLVEYYSYVKNDKFGSFYLDATPDHFFDKKIMNNVVKLDSQALMIVSLRNPIDRAYSHWVMNNGPKKKKEFLNEIPKSCINRSLYFDALKFYKDNARGKFMVCIFEDWVKNEKEFFSQVLLNANLDKFNFKFNAASKNTFYSNQYLKYFSKLIPIPIKRNLPFRGEIRNLFLGNKNKNIFTYEEYCILLKHFQDDIIKTEDLIEISLNSWKEYKWN